MTFVEKYRTTVTYRPWLSTSKHKNSTAYVDNQIHTNILYTSTKGQKYNMNQNLASWRGRNAEKSKWIKNNNNNNTQMQRKQRNKGISPHILKEERVSVMI